MSWILLMVAVGQMPVYLGTYSSSAACTSAIRSIYQAQYNPTNINTPQLNVLMDRLIELQREYRCLPQEK